MCGIVAAASHRDVVPMLLEGLRRLEYRGYDSCGVATLDQGVLKRARTVSRVHELVERVAEDGVKGTVGIAHTRWATHGAPEVCNAHPHISRNRIALVHNGIIENHEEIRRELQAKGYEFTSQTDTEVITYIIDYLGRKLGLTYSEIANVIAAPFWSTIEKQEPKERERLTYLRNAFASLMVTGPFSILVGYTGGLMALNDRLKLRSMVVGEKDDTVYIASEECAIRVIQPELDKLWAPKGGEPVIVNLKNGGNQ